MAQELRSLFAGTVSSLDQRVFIRKLGGQVPDYTDFGLTVGRHENRVGVANINPDNLGNSVQYEVVMRACRGRRNCRVFLAGGAVNAFPGGTSLSFYRQGNQLLLRADVPAVAAVPAGVENLPDVILMDPLPLPPAAAQSRPAVAAPTGENASPNLPQALRRSKRVRKATAPFSPSQTRSAPTVALETPPAVEAPPAALVGNQTRRKRGRVPINSTPAEFFFEQEESSKRAKRAPPQKEEDDILSPFDGTYVYRYVSPFADCSFHQKQESCLGFLFLHYAAAAVAAETELQNEETSQVEMEEEASIMLMLQN
jgi:hypothetical protein